MTVAEARAEFLLRKKDTADIDALAGTFLKWCNYINRYAYRQLVNIMPEQYITSQVYTTTPGTATYTLPVTFQDVGPQGTGLYEITSAGVDTDNRLPVTNFGSSKNGYYVNATQIVFTPVPTETKQYKFRFIPILTDLSGESSTLVIPTRFSYHIMDVLDACYNVWDENEDAEVFNDERVIRSMDEMIANINPIGQTYMLPDFLADF